MSDPGRVATSPGIVSTRSPTCCAWRALEATCVKLALLRSQDIPTSYWPRSEPHLIHVRGQEMAKKDHGSQGVASDMMSSEQGQLLLYVKISVSSRESISKRVSMLLQVSSVLMLMLLLMLILMLLFSTKRLVLMPVKVDRLTASRRDRPKKARV